MRLFRIVTQLYTTRDDRGEAGRPLASDILLGFWKYTANQHLGNLRVIVSQNVEEPFTQRVREEVYGKMGQLILTGLSLRRTSHGAEKDAFKDVKENSKLAKCARTIVEENPEMRQFNDRIFSFEFIPLGSRGRHFHWMVTLSQIIALETRACKSVPVDSRYPFRLEHQLPFLKQGNTW